MFTQPQNRFLFLYPFRIAQLSILVSLGLHVFSCMEEGRPLLRFGPGTILAFILMGFGLLSQYMGVLMTNTEWNGYIDQLTKSAILLIMIEAMAYNVYRVWAIQAAVLFSTLWWVKAGLRLGASGATYGGDRIMGPGVSMVENPNGFAYMFCIVLCTYLYFFQQYPNKYLKGSFLLLAIAALYSIFNTGSRTGIMILVILLIFLLPKYFVQHKMALTLTSVAVVLLLGSVGAMNIERFKTIPESIRSFFSGETINLEMTEGADEHSAVERRLKNRDTWSLIKDYPVFGIGMNPDESVFAEEFPYATGQVHNSILMAGRQMGLIGMTLYGSLVALLFIKGRAIQRIAGPGWASASDLGWTFKLQAVGFAVGGNFSPMPWNTYLFILVGSATAMYINLREMGYIRAKY